MFRARLTNYRSAAIARSNASWNIVASVHEIQPAPVADPKGKGPEAGPKVWVGYILDRNENPQRARAGLHSVRG
jgi:hypothetical protein